MLIIVNKKSYKLYILKTSFLIGGALALFIIIGKLGLIGALLFFIIIELIILSNKFTAEVAIHNGKIRLKYYRWLKLFYKEANMNDITIEKNFAGSLRSPKHEILKFLYKKKPFFSIDSSDGFTEEDFKKISEIIPHIT